MYLNHVYTLLSDHIDPLYVYHSTRPLGSVFRINVYCIYNLIPNISRNVSPTEKFQHIKIDHPKTIAHCILVAQNKVNLIVAPELKLGLRLRLL